MKRKLWTASEILVLKERFAYERTKTLSEAMQRKEWSVSGKAYKLGIKKDANYLKKILKEVSLNLSISGKANVFKKGDVPANKGKKMSKELYEKVSKGFFKKGTKPHNTKEGVGLISTRKDKSGRCYKYIKIADAKWVLLQRHTYEAANGPLKSFEIVIFKDGNSLNCELENLEKITKKENRVRNSPHYTLKPDYIAGLIARNGRKIDSFLATKLMQVPELIKLKKNQIILKRQINETRKR